MFTAARSAAPDRRRPRGLAVVILLTLLLGPAPAGAVMRGDDWRGLWAELGPIGYAPLIGQLHVGTWDRWSVAGDALVFDFVQHQPHWQNLFPGDLPALVVAGGVAAWAAPAPRWRLGLHARHTPRLEATTAGLDAAFQILGGTAESSAFFAGLGGGLIDHSPEWRMWLPRLFLEWSNTFVRGDAKGQKAPWTGLLSARLDQGYRIVQGFGGRPDDADLMATLIRAGVHVRRGAMRFGYDFGLQQGGAFTHALVLQAIWGEPLRAWLDESTPVSRETDSTTSP